MLDPIAQEFALPQRALALRATRTEVLASNMANADTPHYKAVDFDFGQALNSSMTAANSQLALHATHQRHISTHPSKGGAVENVALQYRNAVQPSLDGNTVDMDIERAAFLDNALAYQTTLTFLNHRISTLNLALKGN